MVAWICLVLVGLAGGAIAAFGLPLELIGMRGGAVADVVRIAGLILSVCMALMLSPQGTRRTCLQASVTVDGDYSDRRFALRLPG